MKLKIALLAACLSLAGYSQAQVNLGSSLTDVFDVHNTNSLIAANEINLSPFAVWDAAGEKPGGGLKLDWWVSDQQGAFLSYSEFGDRTSYIQYGYQARTVFKKIEVSLATGMSQRQGDDFGDVRLYVAPTFTVGLWKNADWDLRLMLGADVLAKVKPNPYIGITLRALRF